MCSIDAVRFHILAFMEASGSIHERIEVTEYFVSICREIEEVGGLHVVAEKEVVVKIEEVPGEARDSV